MKNIIFIILFITPMISQGIGLTRLPGQYSSFSINAVDKFIEAKPDPSVPQWNCSALVNLEADIIGQSDCATSRFLSFDISIDLDGNGNIDYLASSDVDLSFLGIWVFDPTDQVYKTYLPPNDIAGFKIVLPEFRLENALKSHLIHWKVSDICGTVSVAETTLSVIDKTAPVADCVSISNVFMNPRLNYVQVWARDYNRNSYDNCTPSDRLYVTFDGVPPMYELINDEHFFKRGTNGSVPGTFAEYQDRKAYLWIPSIGSAGMTMTDIGMHNLNISVWDKSKNTDSCTVKITIINLDSIQSQISGKVMTIKNKPLEKMVVTIDAQIIEFPKNVETDHQGMYSFTMKEWKGYTYSVDGYNIKSKNADVFDLYLLQSHLDGTRKFNYYWQYIAADINQDKQVNSADLLAMQELIKNNKNEWVFINDKRSLNTSNWFTYEKEYIIIHNPQTVGNQFNVGFIGIKLGDIDGNVCDGDTKEVVIDSTNLLSDSLFRRPMNSFEIASAETEYFISSTTESMPNCAVDIYPEASVSGQVDCNNSDLLSYECIINLDDFGSYEYRASSEYDPAWSGVWVLDSIDQIYKSYIQPDLIGSHSLLLPSLSTHIGKHRLDWKAYDQCGNNAMVTSYVIVKDTTAPITSCVSNSTIVLNPNQPTELRAKDIIKNYNGFGNFDNCTSSQELLITFAKVPPLYYKLEQEHYFKKANNSSVPATIVEYYQGNAYKWSPVLKSASAVFRTKGSKDLIISVWDQSGNAGSCTSKANFISNSPTYFFLFGNVKTVKNKLIEKASVTLDAPIVEYPRSFSTNKDGQFYWFLDRNNTFSLTSIYEDKNSKPADNLDILLLESHLNGSRKFNKFWQFIAADMNKDKVVNSIDLEILKVFVRNKIDRWIVIENNTKLTTSDWHKYKDKILIFGNSINAGGNSNVNFLAIKLGDINGNVYDGDTKEVVIDLTNLASDQYNRNSGSTFRLIAFDGTQYGQPNYMSPNVGCTANLNLSAFVEGKTLCSESDFLVFDVAIDFENDKKIEYQASYDFDQSWQGKWVLDPIDNIYKTYLPPSNQSGYQVVLPQFPANYSVIRHKVSWKVSDLCGYSNVAESFITVKDRKPPTPYLISVVMDYFNSVKRIEIFAKNYNKGSFDNCTDSKNLLYTFEGVAPLRDKLDKVHYFKKGVNGSELSNLFDFVNGNCYKWNPENKTASVCFVRSGRFNVNISVWDEYWNTDFGTIVFDIIDFVDHYPTLKGRVKTHNFLPLANAKISYLDQGFMQEEHSISQVSGNYTIILFPSQINVIIYSSYQDTISKKADLNDLETLRLHLSGEQPFLFYWQYIAADINMDRKVDQADFILLESYIQSENNAWVVLHDEQNLTTNNWFEYLETYGGSLNEIYRNNDYYLDFTAIKIGDIDGNAMDDIHKIDHLKMLSPSIESDTRTKIQTDLTISPNPFKNETYCTFNLSHDEDIHYIVSDMQGRNMINQRYKGKQGYNSLTIPGDQLPATGVYFITISGSFGKLNKKLIRLE